MAPAITLPSQIGQTLSLAAHGWHVIFELMTPVMADHVYRLLVSENCLGPSMEEEARQPRLSHSLARLGRPQAWLLTEIKSYALSDLRCFARLCKALALLPS